MRWREFFFLRKSDRQVVLVLLITIVTCTLVLFFVRKSPDSSTNKPVVPTVPSTAKADGKKAPAYYSQPERQAERFTFDPNTADSTQLLRLGLQPWQVRNIYKYRAAGGIYRQKEDFARLYGLTVKQYRELEPYIIISPDYQPASTLVPDRRRQSDSLYAIRSDSLSRLYPKKIVLGEHVDLNAMDTMVYRTVPGVGSYYASKIIQYGQRLGGYTNVDQLDEIDDFPQDAKQYFSVDTSTEVTKIYVNRLSLNELKRHPYINYYQAKAIIDYRRLNGPLRDLQALRLLRDFPPEAISRLRPYVSYDE